MTIDTQVASLTGIVALLSAITFFLWKFFSDLKQIRQERDQKISRIYERFDEYKKHIEDRVKEEFVNQDLCKVIHTNSDTNFQHLETRMEEGFKNIDEKLTDLLKRGV